MKPSTMSMALLLIGLGRFSPSYAQRHLTGLRAIELQGGVVNNLTVAGADNGGYYAGIGYSKYFSSKSYWKVSYDFDKKNYLLQGQEAFSRRYLGGLTYYRTIWKDRGGNLYVNVHFGGMVGYEDINGRKALIEPGLELKAKSKMMYGLSSGIESELYLQDRLALIIQWRERWLIPSDANHFRWYFGAGLKWTLIN